MAAIAQKRPISEVEGTEETDQQATARANARQRRDNSPPSLLQLPSRHWSPRPVAFQKPFQLISFSYTPQRQLVFDNSALKFWVEPPQHADLSHRYGHWIKRREEKGRLDGLLRAINEEPCQDTKRKAHVVCWRGILCKILISPYEERNGWVLNVMMIDNTLYFEEHITEEQLAEVDGMPEKNRQQTYYGYSFESWCTSNRPRKQGERPEWGGDVDTNVQWCSVVKGKMGESRILIGGEVDCIRDRYTGQPDTFVELKTSMTIRRGNTSDEMRFEKKLLKFYFQSFLLGVPEITVGFRDFKGRLQTLQSFKTLEIPRMVRGKPHAWDPNLCLAWGEKFLTQVREWMTQAGSSMAKKGTLVGRLTFTPKEGVKFQLLDDSEVEDVRAGEDRTGFLPAWYMSVSPEQEASKEPQDPAI